MITTRQALDTRDIPGKSTGRADWPLVSICIPVYNKQEYVSATIQSVLNQTYENFELIIVDDCSTDNSGKVVKGFTDKRIRYICNKQNLGAEGNWTKLLGLAGGKYVKLLCCDDILYPECISAQVGVLEDPDNSDVLLVTCNKDVIDWSGKIIMTRKFPGKRGHWNGVSAIKKSVRFGTNIIGEPSAGLFRAGILKSKSVFLDGNLLYVIDLDFWSKMMLHGNLYVIDRVLYGFRVSPTSISASVGLGQGVQFNRFIKKLSLDKRFKISMTDKIVGSLLAFAMAPARKLIYFLYR